jgi:tetratricopeptide (TPR) repeat protein
MRDARGVSLPDLFPRARVSSVYGLSRRGLSEIVTLATDMEQTRQFERCAALFVEYTRTAAALLGPLHIDTVTGYHRLASICGGLGKYGAAMKLARFACFVLARAVGPGAALSTAQLKAAVYSLLAGDRHAAAAAFVAAYDALLADGAVAHTSPHAMTLCNSVVGYVEQVWSRSGAPDEGDLQSLVAREAGEGGSGHPIAAALGFLRARFLNARGEMDAAVAVLTATRADLASYLALNAGGESVLLEAGMMFVMGAAHRKAGRLAEAASAFRDACRLYARQLERWPPGTFRLRDLVYAPQCFGDLALTLCLAAKEQAAHAPHDELSAAFVEARAALARGRAFLRERLGDDEDADRYANVLALYEKDVRELGQAVEALAKGWRA